MSEWQQYSIFASLLDHQNENNKDVDDNDDSDNNDNDDDQGDKNIIPTFVLFGRHSDPNELRQRPAMDR